MLFGACGRRGRQKMCYKGVVYSSIGGGGGKAESFMMEVSPTGRGEDTSARDAKDAAQWHAKRQGIEKGGGGGWAYSETI